MKTINWRHEPKGPGRFAEHMFLDAGGERVERLVYDDITPDQPRLCGFEVFGRLKEGGPFWEQLAAGECNNIDAAKAAALAMVARPRSEWSILPRSWVKR
jgi:hypothetical protein